jgi:hypothetical protein
MSDTLLIVLAALGGELVFLLLVLLGVSWWRNKAARRRDAEAIAALVGRAKKSRVPREAAIEQFLGEGLGLSGDALQRTKARLVRAELGLLQRFAMVYRRRDADAAACFDLDMGSLLQPYHALHADVREEQEPVAPGELEDLRAENRRLSQELRATVETMSRMLNEYSSMFTSGAQGGEAPIAAPNSPKSAVASPDGEAAARSAPGEAVEAGAREDETAPAENPSETQPGGGAEAVPRSATVQMQVATPSDGLAAESRDAPQPAADAAEPDSLANLLEEGAVEVVGYDDGEDGIEEDADLFDGSQAQGADDNRGARAADASLDMEGEPPRLQMRG